MINNITLKNFKGFKEMSNLEIKPITILCGTNSSGKSSILQSILLFKQTMEGQNPNQTILLNGRYVHLGSIQDCIYMKNTDLNIEFDFFIRCNYKDFHKLPIHFIVSSIFKNIEDKNVEFQFTYKTKIKTDQVGYKGFLNPILVDELEFRIEAFLDNKPLGIEPSILIKNIESNFYNVKWKDIKNEKKKNGNTNIKIRFGRLFPSSVSYDDKDIKEPMPLLLFLMSEIINSFFVTYSYIGPLREEPSRRYIYENEITDIGSKGENAAYIYLTEQDNVIHSHYFYENGNFIEKFNLKLSDALTVCLELMDIKGLYPESVNDIIQVKMDSNTSEHTIVNIADVGFGVSQILPIVLEGLRMPKNHTLLLEQPEIHLHPNLQMQLADYFISLALSQKKLIIETHSDHIINRLVHRIVEDDSGKLKDLINIYFFTTSINGIKCEKVIIDDINGIVNWPKDFFDQNALEQEKIIRAGINKRRKSRR